MSSQVVPDSAYGALEARRGELERASRSAQIADIVRESILGGTFLPGVRLSEPDICAALGVSRNTLREAFRTLVEERLVSHELNRGVFVRVPTPDDVAEIYKCRRVIEGAAVRDCPPSDPGLDALRRAVERAERSSLRGDWLDVGGADIEFHRGISALNHSSRLDGLLRSVWNELRLVFHVMNDPHTLHQAYLARNREIFDHLTAGDNAAAERLLLTYLADAEAQLLGAYTGVAVR